MGAELGETGIVDQTQCDFIQKKSTKATNPILELDTSQRVCHVCVMGQYRLIGHSGHLRIKCWHMEIARWCCLVPGLSLRMILLLRLELKYGYFFPPEKPIVI